MAVHLATSADYLQRTTALLPTSGSRTWMVWTKQSTIPTAGGKNVAMASINLTPATYNKFGRITQNDTPLDSLALAIDTSVSTTHASASVDVWTHHVWQQSGTSNRYYRNGVLIGTVTQNLSHLTSTFDLLGGDSTGVGNYTLAYCRQWTIALSQSQIFTELQSPVAVTTSGLFMDCPLTSDILDISGNGHDWTQNGSATFVAGPVFPSNGTKATATAIGVLPQSITQDFDQSLTLWYSYTGHASEVIFGAFGLTNLSDQIVLTVVDSADNLTYLGISTTNTPVQIPIADGVTVYLRLESVAGLATDSLVLSVLPGPTTAIAVGSIFTNDDVVGFPAAVVSSATGSDYQVLQFFNFPATNSENGGDVLSNGRFLLVSDDDTTFKLYDAQFALVTTVAALTSTSSTPVRTCLTPQVFYVGKTPATDHIARIDGAGLVTDTWTLPATGISGLAASNDELVIYIIGSGGSPVNSAVKQFNPNTSTFGSDLAAGIATYSTLDILVIGDDSVVVIYAKTAAATQIKRYDAAGTTLNTYTLGTPLDNATQCSLFHAIDDPTSFWTRVHSIGTANTCVFYNIKASDGTILATIVDSTYSNGIDTAAVSATPSARFGISLSCPSFVLRGAVSPIPTPAPVEYMIRRERWFPVISSGLKRQFFSKLQIDMQTGNGLSTGQGSNPLMEIDWSDDSGWTWSSIRFVETGRIGAYGWRPMARNLSYGRNRVFRIAVSDPVQWVVVGAELDAVLGTS